MEAKIESLPFDSACARAYGRIYAAVVAVGSQGSWRLARST